MSYNCHVCHTQQVTRVTHKTGTLTIIVVLILCLLGLWPCALIPLCVPALQDTVHTCPNCNTQVGVHKKVWNSWLTLLCFLNWPCCQCCIHTIRNELFFLFWFDSAYVLTWCISPGNYSLGVNFVKEGHLPRNITLYIGRIIISQKHLCCKKRRGQESASYWMT